MGGESFSEVENFGPGNQANSHTPITTFVSPQALTYHVVPKGLQLLNNFTIKLLRKSIHTYTKITSPVQSQGLHH